jgi:CelD/BcsL family acetyltransferase involved in cellulose biosynthesis
VIAGRAVAPGFDFVIETMRNSLSTAAAVWENPVRDPASACRIEAFTTDAAFDAIAAEWDELLDSSGQCVFFLRWSWVRRWWESLAPAGSQLMLLGCRDAGNRLIGLAPLYRQTLRAAGIPYRREIHFLGTGIPMQTSEYLNLIARRGFEADVAEAIAACLKSDTSWDTMHLWGVPADSSTLSHFCRALGPSARMTTCDLALSIDTTQSWETIAAGFSKKFRSNIERCANRLQKLHQLEFQCVETRSEFDAAMEALIRLHQARWQSKGERGSFAAAAAFEEFLRNAGLAALAEGRLRFWTLSIDGACAAALIAFHDNGIVHYFQGGFDPAYAKESLGSVMLKFCIQDCIASGVVSAFDFMGGGSDYKRQWANVSRDIAELEMMRQTLPAFAFRLFRRSKQLATPGYRALKTMIRK